MDHGTSQQVLTVLPRNLVHEGFGRELFGGHAITAQRIGAHSGVAINLFFRPEFHAMIELLIAAR
jgi:hypothetical protein